MSEFLAGLGPVCEAERHKMVRFLRGRYGEDAEDALHDGLVNAISRQALFDGSSKLSTWIMRIAINKGVDTLRRESQRPDKEKRAARRELVSLSCDLEMTELEAGVESALNALLPHWRVVLIEAMKGRPAADIASENGWTLQATRNYLHLARVRMRESLIEAGLIHEDH